MDARRFFIVDVFAESRYSGNQLAVFLNGHLYADDEMQRIAREMNFSETTFILPHQSRDGTHRVRIFTPAAEVPFAGHPTLGTAWVIATHLLDGESPAEVTLDLKAGQIPVALERDATGTVRRLIMRQLPPRFGPPRDAAVYAAQLGLPADALDPRYPVQEVSTGLAFVIVPLRRLADVQGLNAGKIAAAAAPGDPPILVFCPETEDPANGLHARVFVWDQGIPEDPATGSANGNLAGYLAAHQYFGSGTVQVRVEQGLEMGRPSVLYLAAAQPAAQLPIMGRPAERWLVPEQVAAAIRIQVGGRVQPVAEGVWGDR
jgi:trans-2,3-dihydro-3-hydroxyanthranilate isomerase